MSERRKDHDRIVATRKTTATTTTTISNAILRGGGGTAAHQPKVLVEGHDFVLFDDEVIEDNNDIVLTNNTIARSPPFVYEGNGHFSLMVDAPALDQRQQSTVTVSTTDGITVLRGVITNSNSSPKSYSEQQKQLQPQHTQHTNYSRKQVENHPFEQEKDNIYHWTSNLMGRFLNNLWFKRILIALILAQSILVAISTTNYVTESEELVQMFETARRIFLSVFTVELLFRLIRYRFYIFKSGWLLWDVVVIGMAWVMPELLILRTFRVLRSLRHATRFHPIREMIVALGRCVPKVVPVLCFAGIIFYVFAVIFTSYFKDDMEEFQRLDNTLFTLFQIMTLDEWSSLVRTITESERTDAWVWLSFCFFISVSSWFVVNVLVVIMIHGIVTYNNLDNHPCDLPPSEFTKVNLTCHRLETKVDQLIGCVEAMRQKQSHMHGMVNNIVRKRISAESPTARTLHVDSLDDYLRADDDFMLMKD